MASSGRLAFLLGAFLAAALVLESQERVPQVDLSSVRAFYLSASYDEALAILDGIGQDDGNEQVDQYRALCYLALGRTAEAERALEQIVLRNPAYAMAEAEVSPQLVDLFYEIRPRALPAALRRVYNHAKSAFDGGDFATAAKRFRRVIRIARDEESAEASSLADLRHLSEGFLKLSEGKLASAASSRP